MAKYDVWVTPADAEKLEELDHICTVSADPNEILAAIDVLFPEFINFQLTRVRDEPV